jgi:hypothetical protein
MVACFAGCNNNNKGDNNGNNGSNGGNVENGDISSNGNNNSNGVNGVESHNLTETENVVAEYFAAIKAGDFDQAKEYYSKDSDRAIDHLTVLNFERKGDYTLEPILDSIGYKIISSTEVNDENTIVRVEITAGDLNKLQKEYVSMVEANFFDTSEISAANDEQKDELIKEKFLDLIKDSPIVILTETVDIEMHRIDDTWFIVKDSQLDEAVFGDIDLFASSLSSFVYANTPRERIIG